MHRAKGSKKPGARPKPPQGSANPTRTTNKSRNKSAIATATRHSSRLDRRSKPYPDLGPPLGDPETLLRKARKPRKPKETAKVEIQPESQPPSQPEFIARSIEISPTEDNRYIDDNTPYGFIDEASSPLQSDTDPEDSFNRKWGYLPPLSKEAADIIEAVFTDPSMAQRYERINPSHQDFPEGLVYRNVFLMESAAPDPYENHIRLLEIQESVAETDVEKECHGQLWRIDQDKCNEGSKEALFQRTLMMSLIARHRFIYHTDASRIRSLDFSVEEPWSCPPMPTRAYKKRTKFLTQPKPDLAVSFCRHTLMSNSLWNKMPKATQRLACCEISRTTSTRVFPFFTIEAKKAEASSGNTVGKLQSLNNASQALHNMFEFFRDAGPQHEDKFFNEVRFFSVVASTEGLTIRIHRATKEPADGSGEGLIIEDRLDYPLRFEHREFYRIERDGFDRKPVLEMLERILVGYGATELRLLLQNAAEALVKKLANDPVGERAREDEDFYRYGQTIKLPRNSTQTPTTNRGESIQINHLQRILTMERPSRAPSERYMSIDMSQSGTTTPTQKTNVKGKRARAQSDEIGPTRRTRQRK
ncbi:hypothetical protein GJ744_009490 [Endocarpon pusillum]|uniref:DUF7924 domain-containing protein n=1 Tax=Endocarpon pusillum TaxID=364733 RepID=A0A8H7AFW2_9EURO|nr:hypothetical protein GJ744_009490 [Endocarpon pusillum]